MKLTSSATLLIRADADARIGAGHVMRCLALAQSWRDAGGAAIFLMAAPEPKIAAHLQAAGMQVAVCAAPTGSTTDAIQTSALAEQAAAPWIVLDGYHFDAAYQNTLQSGGYGVLCIDDLCRMEHYYADILLNPNIFADADCYRTRCEGAELLMGVRYALLRPEFQEWRDWQRTTGPLARRVLVSLGGGDHSNVSAQVVEALQTLQQRDLEVKLLAGPANPHRRSLEHAARDTAFALEVCEAGAQMPELMAWADLAISAGGGTCWELAFMGLPSLVIVIADNQRRNAEQLDARGVAINLGEADELSNSQMAAAFRSLQSSPQKRSVMSQRGRALVDGEGCQRVVARLLDHGNTVSTGAAG